MKRVSNIFFHVLGNRVFPKAEKSQVRVKNESEKQVSQSFDSNWRKRNKKGGRRKRV